MNFLAGKCLWLLLIPFCFSCQKERETSVAILHLQPAGKPEEIEWLETAAGRQESEGLFYIDAQGAQNERFQLSLQNIKDTGVFTGLQLSQLRFSDGAGFTSRALPTGFVRISERDSRRLSGSFALLFMDAANSAQLLSVNGFFTVLGGR